jgi:preprotein translocase subunit SecY
MFKTISNFMRVGDIRSKILFTLLMLVVFRIGTFIPVPNVNADVLKAQDELNVFGILNTFGGGALYNFSSDGNYAIYHCFDHHSTITDGCCTEIH